MATYDKDRTGSNSPALVLGDSNVANEDYDLGKPCLYPWSSTNIINSKASKVLATNCLQNERISITYPSSFLTDQGDFALKNLFIIPYQDITSDQSFSQGEAIAIGGIIKKDCVFYEDGESDENQNTLVGTLYSKNFNDNINFAINHYRILFKNNDNNFMTLSKQHGLYIKEQKSLTLQSKELELNINSGFRFETIGKSKILMRSIGDEKKIIMQSGGTTDNKIEFSSNGKGKIADSLVINNITINKEGMNGGNKISFLKNSIVNEDILINKNGLKLLTNGKVTSDYNLVLNSSKHIQIDSPVVVRGRGSNDSIYLTYSSGEHSNPTYFSDVTYENNLIKIWRKECTIENGMFIRWTDAVSAEINITERIYDYIRNSENQSTITGSIDTESIINEAIGRLFEALHINNGGPLSAADIAGPLAYLQNEYGFNRSLNNI